MPLIDLVAPPERAARPAVLADGQAMTYGELAGAVDGLARRLQYAGVTARSKVAIALPNVPAFVTALFAVNRIGAVYMPVNPLLPESERERIEAVAEPAFRIEARGDAAPDALKLLRVDGPRPDPELDDVCALIFTSGTTGEPKGAMFTEDALLANAKSVCRYLSLTAADRTLIFLPLFYTYALSQLLTTLLAGGTVVLLKNLVYPAVAMRHLREGGVTGFGGVPTSLNILAGHAAGAGTDAFPLRYILNAGGPLAPSLAARLRDAFPSAHVFNNYGCTEIGPRATAISYTEHPDRIGSIGRAIDGVDVRLIREDGTLAAEGEVAEIVLAGASLMKGYYRNAAATASAMGRWGFHTGDYARADADGFLFYEGRRDDIFKCAGEKVSAREIEDVLLEHETVLEVAVTAQPDPLWGHAPVAHIVLRDGGGVSTEQLQTFCGRRLARHKVPRRFLFVAALDKTSTGKVRKHRLNAAVS